MFPDLNDLTQLRRRAWGLRDWRRTPAVALFSGVGALLVGAAVTNGLLARRAERKHPPQGRFVYVDGVRLHYLEKGAGSPIVLIHGNGVTADDFELSGLFDLLAENHRVVAFDRPGFGYSERPRRTVWTAKAQANLLRQAWKQLGMEKPLVIGHSWGTLVAINIGLEHATDTSGLVLMSGYYMPTVRIDVLPTAIPAIPIVGDLMRYTVSPLIGLLITPLQFKQMFSPSRVSRRFKEGYSTSMALRPSVIHAVASDTANMVPGAAKSWPRVGELAMPILIIAGDGDKVVSCRDQSERLAQDIRHGMLHVLKGRGHMIHHLAPMEIAATIEAFLMRAASEE